MSKTDLTLAYRNEDDKAYGLAGMIISLGTLDALDTVLEASLDSPGPMITFTGDYYYSTTPKASAKAAWENLKRNFYVTASMVMGNVMARSMVRDRRPVPAAVLTAIKQEMTAEGTETVALDPDEIERLYDHIELHTRRLFSNPHILPAVRHLSSQISTRRHLSAADIAELLERL